MMRPLNILFVCLSQPTVESLSSVLRNGGFDICVEHVDDPKKLAEVLSQRFNVVLVDSLSRHPKLVEQIQALLAEKYLDIPVLVYSSAGDEVAIVAAMKAGAKDFISSGNPKRVLSAVKREISSAQQRAASRKQADTDALLQKIDAWMLQGWDVEPLAKKICQHAVQLFDLRLAWIGGKQAEGGVNVVAAAGCVEYLQQLDVRWDDARCVQCPVGAAIINKQHSVSKVDAPAFAPLRRAAEQYGIQSILVLPMLVRDEVIGVLAMYSARRDAFDAASVKRYTAFTNRLAVNLYGAQENQQFRLLSAAINNATQAIFITAHDGKIVWLNQALCVMSGYSAEEIMNKKPHLFSSGKYENAFWDRMWHDIEHGKMWTGDVLNRNKEGILYSVLQSITPLYNSQGELTHFLCVQQDVSEKKELERKIEYLAYHDVLTGLPNRTLFNDRMQLAISQAKRDQSEFSLLFVDLDGFKDVNDKYGHAAGDDLLKMVAERLRSCVREGDTVARLGGDEFIVLLRDVAADQGLIQITRKIIERIARPYELDMCVAHITASIGISRYPDDAVLADKLMSFADEAMYAAKHAGKNRYALWSSPGQTPVSSDWQI
jgi:diguanylate cyclase (GGDEF)-like protein/PAS domain S-box-containing protein